MITNTEIAMSIIEIVGWAVDEDVTSPKNGMMQLKGLRMALSAMGVHFTWHREVAKWEDMLAGYARCEDAKQYKTSEKVRQRIQQRVLEAYRGLKDNGYIAPALDGRMGIVFNEAKPVSSITIPYGVEATP